MPETKRPLKVFLCHAHSDQTRVRDLYKRLTADGVDVWLDKERLLPGQDWELEIQRAVRESDVVIVCLSQQFNQRGFRQKEVRLALDTAMEQPEGEIFIIPARLEECENLNSLRKWHRVDLFEENGYERLIFALRARANKIDATLEIEKERIEREIYEKRKQEARRIAQQEVDKQVKNVKRRYKREVFFLNLRNKLSLFSIYSRYYIFPAILGLFILAGVIFGRPALISIFFPTKTVTPTEISPLPSLTATGVSETAVTEISLPTEITDEFGVEMVLVPAGNFTMGSSNDDPFSVPADAKPAHQIYLDSYYVDKYEVTNLNYKICVSASACQPPTNTSSSTRSSYYGNSEFDGYPVIYVNWEMAKTYCEWRSGGLPTEAQWEKAARGTDSRRFPWGNDVDRDKKYSNYSQNDTTAVGQYQMGSSPYDIYDMAGNVWEWVADWYDPKYYQNSTSSNPIGPSSGQHRVLRGGSWYNYWDFHFVYARSGFPPTVSNSLLGFRCVNTP